MNLHKKQLELIILSCFLILFKINGSTISGVDIEILHSIPISDFLFLN